MKINNIVAELEALDTRITDLLKQAAQGLEDNPKHKVISKNIIIVQFKDLKNRWTFSDLVILEQYERVIKTLDRLSGLEKIERLKKIVKEEKVTYCEYGVQFHTVLNKKLVNRLSELF